MIEVKATKAQTGEADPAARYRLKQTEERSKLPYAFALFLTAVAAYLKAMFPGEAKQDVPASSAEPEAASAAEESDLALAGQAPLPAAGEPPEPDLPQEEARVGSGDPLFGEPSALHQIPLIEMPHYDTFVNDELQFDWDDGIPAFSRPRVAANDNGGATLPDISVPTTPDPDGETPDDQDPPTDEDEDEDDSEAANRAPRLSGPVYLADISGCAILAIGLADLLENAVDPDGDELAIENIRVSAGDLTESAWGWTFETGQHFGPVTITYEVSDGEFSVAQTAHFSVVRKAVTSTEEDDLLLGSMCGDDIDGRGGNDNIDGRAGDDVVSGGAGDDHIVAGDGNDVVFAGAGDDIVFGGAGDDHIDGGAGNDRLFGDAGDDVVYGGAGEDEISGGEGDDVVEAGAGDDEVDGGSGDDVLIGDAGDDVIADGAGSDVVEGGEGSDTLVAAIDDADDRYDGGEGIDTADFSKATAGLAVDLDEGSVESEEAGSNTLQDIEVFMAGSGDDTVTGGSADETIHGNAGGDIIDGGDGADRLDGGSGDDLIADGAGSDTVEGGEGDDTLVAANDAASDSYSGGPGKDTVDYSDTITGLEVDLDSGTAESHQSGNDTLQDIEVLMAGSGDDALTGSSADEAIHGNGGDDVIDGAGGADNLQGGSGDDVIEDGSGADSIDGGTGDDVVLAAPDEADDHYDGGDGTDTLDYSAATEDLTIDVGAGTASGEKIGEDDFEDFESFCGGEGDDRFIVSEDAAVLTGGDGDDTFEFCAPPPSAVVTVHEIHDFEVGDRVRMSKYDLFERAFDQLEDRFEEIYGDGIDDDDVAIRYRHESVDEFRSTIIEADFNRDDIYETMIQLQGHRVLVAIEHAIGAGELA